MFRTNTLESITYLHSNERAVNSIFATNSSTSVYPGTTQAPTFRHFGPPMSREYHKVLVIMWNYVSFLIILFVFIYFSSYIFRIKCRKQILEKATQLILLRCCILTVCERINISVGNYHIRIPSITQYEAQQSVNAKAMEVKFNFLFDSVGFWPFLSNIRHHCKSQSNTFLTTFI